ncbi:hypothetical protein FN846DRAFT_928230 [Sphaerosporella brunnea]|uniref:Uncharacterized protein n=1 Tax=Sphaerosporella brunnea TaxID=1250544 RepID=A0A5J5FA78_9PEZI|nr:hypothetical protein FN846DRAFT_928230 [Sphaerosporella brunnea]
MASNKTTAAIGEVVEMALYAEEKKQDDMAPNAIEKTSSSATETATAIVTVPPRCSLCSDRANLMLVLERLYTAETEAYDKAQSELAALRAESLQNKAWVLESFKELRALVEELGPLRRTWITILLTRVLVRCGYFVMAYAFFSLSLHGSMSLRDLLVFCVPIAVLIWVCVCMLMGM